MLSRIRMSVSRKMVPLGARVFSSEPAVRTLIVYNVLQGIYLGYIRIFWQPWMVALGISIATIGVLESGAGRNGAISGLMQVVGGRFSDRRGRRRLILAGSGFLIACWLTSASAFFYGSSALVYLAYLLWGLSLLSLPVIDAMMADYIETPDRSRVYSTMLVANFIPGSITGFLAGQYGASKSSTSSCTRRPHPSHAISAPGFSSNASRTNGAPHWDGHPGLFGSWRFPRREIGDSSRGRCQSLCCVPRHFGP